MVEAGGGPVSVNRSQRHTKNNRCPVCGGCEGDPRGKEKRCHGFTTEDGEWCHCTREEHAGDIDAGPDGCFSHRMHGPCRCGMTHNEARSGTVARDNFEATYDYRDEGGRLLYQVVRKPGKEFRQRRPDGADGWLWQLEGVRRVIYRLPQVIAASADVPVYIVEGEKDVDNLVAKGYVATCNSGGAGKWNPVVGLAQDVLRGRDVIVVADADDVGRLHAATVARSLDGSARSVRVVEPTPHKDVSDLLAAGGSVETMGVEAPRHSPAQELAPELPFDEIWTKEPDVSLVIPGLGICPGPAHLVAGSWYTGKTLFLMAMGFAVASGRELFGLHFVKKGRWTHFDHEMGRRGAKRYMQRVQAGLGLGTEEMRGNISLRILPRLNLCTAGAFELYCELLEGSAICTIDPLRAAAPGQDENSSEFRQWIDMLNAVSDRTGCAICVLHHGGKPVEGSARRNTGRGTSAIDDAVQSKFVLTAEEKGAPISVSHEKTRELTETLEDFWLQIVSERDSVRLVHRCKEEMASLSERTREEKEQARTEKAKEAIRAAFIRFAGKLPGPRDSVIRTVGGERAVTQKAFSEMLASGEIGRSGGRGEVCFGLRYGTGTEAVRENRE